MADSSIQWTDAVWNPVVGCSRVSPGCGGAAGEGGCYAERMAYRLEQMGRPEYQGLTRKTNRGRIGWTGIARFVPERLGQPLKWKKPQRIFVNSMSDLFHDDVTNEQIAAVFAMMLLTPRHTYQVLTKRPERMRELLGSDRFYDRVLQAAEPIRAEHPELMEIGISNPSKWPAKWIWLGVSCEDQKRADERVPLLLKTPAAVRFVSAEPLIGPIDLAPYVTKLDSRCCPTCGFRTNRMSEDLCPNDGAALGDDKRIDWVICGGESGPGARPCDVEWIRSIVEQCAAAEAPCFVKQLGSKPCELDVDEVCGVEYWPTIRLRDRKGGDINEFPEDLRIRLFPGDAWP